MDSQLLSNFVYIVMFVFQLFRLYIPLKNIFLLNYTNPIVSILNKL